MNILAIKLKYSLIAFIIAFTPYTIIISILRQFESFTPLYSNTLLFFGIITAITNSIYIYISISKKTQNKIN